jgi:hypothetical protein
MRVKGTDKTAIKECSMQNCRAKNGKYDANKKQLNPVDHDGDY